MNPLKPKNSSQPDSPTLEIKFKELEERYQRLFDNLGDEVHLWKVVRDSNGEIENWELVDANPSALKAWGQKRKEVIGKTAKEIFGEGAIHQFMPLVRGIIESGETSSWTEFFEPTQQYLSMASVPMGEYFISTGQDITEQKVREEQLKESEEKYRHLAENIPGIIFQYRLNTDGSDELLYVSQAVADLFDVTQEEALDDLSLLQSKVIREDLIQFFEIRDASARDLSPMLAELRLAFPNQIIKWLSIRGTPTQKEDGCVVWDCIGLDITARKQAEQEIELLNQDLERRVEERTREIQEVSKEREEALNHLKETQSQLIQSEKLASLGILTAGVAHEINNPLNYILGGHSAILQHIVENDNISKEELHEYLRWIKTGADRATQIVRSLNQFSRSGDRFDLECQLPEIIEDCLMILAHKLTKDTIITKSYFSEDITIIGNDSRLHQVLLNLIGNAIDAIEGSGEIKIKIEDRNDNISIIIEDNGYGISKENLNKVSDPFFTTKPPGIGTGLGLYISKAIIQEHKGALFFTSEEGKGSTFTVQFPKRQSK